MSIMWEQLQPLLHRPLTSSPRGPRSFEHIS